MKLNLTEEDKKYLGRMVISLGMIGDMRMYPNGKSHLAGGTGSVINQIGKVADYLASITNSVKENNLNQEDLVAVRTFNQLIEDRLQKELEERHRKESEQK